MSAEEIDAYLASIPEPKRSTLEELRRRILVEVPEAEQCISYAMPAFRIGNKVVAGFAAFKNHLAYLPHSGMVLSEMQDELKKFVKTTGSLHFPVDTCLDQALVSRLIEIRKSHLGL